MPGSRRRILLTVAAAILLVGGGLWLGASRWAPMTPAPAPIRTSAKIVPKHKVFSPGEIAELQADATESCKCARAATDQQGKTACWAEFERTRSTYPGAQATSPCGSLSPQWACFGDGEDGCVITKYSAFEDVSFCTPEEAREVEGAIAKAYEAGNRNDLAVMRRFERAYREGRKPLSSFEGGCAG